MLNLALQNVATHLIWANVPWNICAIGRAPQQLERERKVGPGNRATEVWIRVGKPYPCVLPFRLELVLHGFADVTERWGILPVRKDAVEPLPVLSFQFQEQFSQPAMLGNVMEAECLLERAGELTGIFTRERRVRL